METSQYINLLTNFVVGTTFFLSGLVKLNDPLGFAYKIEEYLHLFVNQLTGYARLLLPYTLVLSISVATLEFVLGIALLVYWHSFWTLRTLFLLTLFFAFLTLYTAISKRLTSCGCLGDALVLTPWQSFVKNVALLFLLGRLCWQETTAPTSLSSYYWIVGALLFALRLSRYTLRHLPVLDFLPYKIGNDLTQQPPQATAHSTHFDVWQGNQAVTQALYSGNKLLVIAQHPVSITAPTLQRLYAMIQQVHESLQPILLAPNGHGEEVAIALKIAYCTTNPLLLRTMLRAPLGFLLLKEGIVACKWNFYDFIQFQNTLKKL